MRPDSQTRLLPRVEPDPKYLAPAGHKHTWYPGEYVWSSPPWNETAPRMVYFCHTCPEIRGRVGDA